MTVTLIAGGCIACPQFFMLPKAKTDCCKAGKCERPAPQEKAPVKECKRMPLEPQHSVQVHADLPVAVIGVADLAGPQVTHSLFSAPPECVEHSPPELHVLNSTFLI